MEAEHQTPACRHTSKLSFGWGSAGRGLLDGLTGGSVSHQGQLKTRPDKVKEVPWCFIDPSHGFLEGKDTDISPYGAKARHLYIYFIKRENIR